MHARWASAVLVFAITCIAKHAHADRVTDAEELFLRGKALIAQGKHVEACPLLAESYRLDPGMGTLLNVALCHEQIGKTASAWGEFRSVEQQARAATPPNESRAKLAHEHAEKLLPRLSRIKLIVTRAAHAPGLVIKVDGEDKAEALWSTGIAVDPGTRLVEASAPQKKAATTKVRIDDEGVVQEVALAPLDDAPNSPVGVQRTVDAELESVEEYAANRARRTTGYVIGGLGLATLAVGGVFGVAAIVNDNDAKSCSPCIRGSSEAAASGQATDRALVFANITNVTVPLGLIGAAAGAYLVLSSGPTAKVAVRPMTTRTGAGLAVTGAW